MTSYLFSDKNNKYQCPICFETINVSVSNNNTINPVNHWKIKIFYCGHFLCENCYLKYNKKYCPVCRKNLKIPVLSQFGNRNPTIYFRTLDDWFNHFYDKIGLLFYNSMKYWKPNRNSWSGIYKFMINREVRLKKKKK